MKKLCIFLVLFISFSIFSQCECTFGDCREGEEQCDRGDLERCECKNDVWGEKVCDFEIIGDC